MPEHLLFLKIVWRLFTEYSTEEFPSRWVSNFVADRLIGEIGRRIHFDRLLSIVETENAIDESFDKTVLSIKANWNSILPETKVDLIESVKALNLTNHFGSMLYLTSEEKQALKIRWHVSDILYFEGKRKAIEECRKRGLDLERHRLDFSHNRMFPDIISECTEIFINLLKSKIEADLAVVSIAAPRAVVKYLGQVSERTLSEYLDLLDEFRKPIREFKAFLMGIEKPESLWSSAEDFEVTGVTEKTLEPFRNDFEELRKKISTLRPSPEVYSRVRELTGNDDDLESPMREVSVTIGEMIMRDKYTVGQAGAVGPNSQAHDMSFNQIWNQIQPSIDLPRLAVELSRLRQEMKKEAVEPEHDIAVSEVARAEQAAKAGDGSQVIEHLKAAGKWALDVGTKIGTELVIQVTKAAIGI
jgi:hypothetical protein